jgi:HEAT repeat protein
MRGRDLRPIATGAAQELGPVFSAVIHKKMVVAWPYKLIADLRFGLFELYDLEHDPHERDNLADKRTDLVASLKLEVYGWLDSLAPSPDKAKADDGIAVALDWGRLGDRRAVAPLSKLVARRDADPDKRVEAARMLGHLADEHAAGALVSAMGDAAAPRVAAEAAIALGRMFDPRARQALRRLVRAEDSDIRVRAAVSLGRLRDPEAVPALIDSLWIAKGEYERQEAVRWLGRLRDERALQPLIDLLPELRTRFLVVVAIGQIGDRRAYERLANVLVWDRHANVRDATLQGLGLLGDPRAAALIAPLAADDTALTLAPETLVRLGAIKLGVIGGADLAAGDPTLRDFTDCYAGPLQHDWDYLHRTYCISRNPSAELDVPVPKAVSDTDHGAVIVLGLKRNDAPAPTDLKLSIAGRTLDPQPFDGAWKELRWTLPPGALHAGRTHVKLEATDAAARFAVDHLLVLPRTSVIVAQQGN